MYREKDVLAGCIKGRPSAQRKLYEQHSAMLLAICSRYASDRDEAEDMLQEGFVKIFLNIKKYNGDGPLLAWMRRVVINTAITYYHRMRKHRYHDDLEEVNETRFADKGWEDADFTGDELFALIRTMPEGYKQVFNLYAVEGYKHREIAELMQIDENTSKSQFSRARKWLQLRLTELKKESKKKETFKEDEQETPDRRINQAKAG